MWGLWSWSDAGNTGFQTLIWPSKDLRQIVRMALIDTITTFCLSWSSFDVNYIEQHMQATFLVIILYNHNSLVDTKKHTIIVQRWASQNVQVLSEHYSLVVHNVFQISEPSIWMLTFTRKNFRFSLEMMPVTVSNCWIMARRSVKKQALNRSHWSDCPAYNNLG